MGASKLSKTARCAIGIREIKEYLDGRLSLAQAKELIKKNTRRYALRQLCWFRKDKRIQWIELGDKDSPDSIAQKILARLPG
jgi:tRNA dimethylallyltransferase